MFILYYCFSGGHVFHYFNLFRFEDVIVGATRLSGVVFDRAHKCDGDTGGIEWRGVSKGDCDWAEPGFCPDRSLRGCSAVQQAGVPHADGVTFLSVSGFSCV